MKKQYPGATRLKSDYPGLNMKNNQFDQVWQTADGKIIIVEAKGGSSTLGSRLNANGELRVQQGTPEYKDSVINTMEQWYKKNRSNPDKNGMQQFKDTLTKLKDESIELEYIVVKQPVNQTTGQVRDNIIVSNYDMNKGKA
ncbi:hypothetical protein [uncultured Photobacterium sp.]|uniref:hypothetical protein n=1 Tax=uncultured Photobacterium sp. TaxID=173973 RepID=UPI0026244182|nr:hypothetical protein [uncultured Photobacterium sp.]